MNLCVALFMIFSAYQLKRAINTSGELRGISVLATEYPLESVFICFCVVINVAVFTYLIKHLAEHREQNGFTLFATLFDIALVAFFVLLGKDVILAGNILKSPMLLVGLAISSVSVICDLLSLPAERWG